MNHCRHGIAIGGRCLFCVASVALPEPGVVGGSGPTPAAGQIWAERGGAHGLLQVEEIQLISVGADVQIAEALPPTGHVILSAITAEWCGSFPLADFPDEFWFWGLADELSEALREGVAAMRTLTRIRLALDGPKAPFARARGDDHQPADVAAVAFVVGELLALRDQDLAPAVDLRSACAEIAGRLASHFDIEHPAARAAGDPVRERLAQHAKLREQLAAERKP